MRMSVIRGSQLGGTVAYDAAVHGQALPVPAADAETALGALSTIAGARAERVHERSLIDASLPWALVDRDAHGHIPLALSAATVVGQEPHVVDAAVSRPVAVGAQHRPRHSHPRDRWGRQCVRISTPGEAPGQ